MRQAPIRTTRKTSPARRKGRSRLLGGASALAAAVMMLVAPQQASAQVAVTGRAFEANPIGTTGVSSITRTDTLDTVQIAGSEAVITWRPIDTATSSAVIDILPVGNTLAFTGDGNYTVLNRVIPDDPTRAIQFNGGVVSLNGGALGGNIWFYSPGGIIAGPTSVFLVGGLVLTSSNMTGIGAGGNQMNFLGATAGSRVEVQPGARLLSSDYMVLWAPRVIQGGGVSSGGNISYVGAEQGTLTVTGGLFNMVIDVGTDDPNGVVHTGITTGPTPVDGPVRAITMATVAKNDFVNMLVGGAVGYANASVATASNGVIVLSAANGTQPNSGNITIGPAFFNSNTIASASGDLTIDLDGPGEILNIGSATNESDFIGFAGRNVTINATSGATINAFDNFFAQAASPGQGGTLTVNINDAGRDDDSSISGLLVGGNLVLSAFGNGVDNIPLFVGGVTVSPTFGGDGNGGTIGINVSQGGELTVGGTTILSAAGTAGIGGLFSGDATGGVINFTLNGNNSRVQLTGDALFDVSANRSSPGPVTAGGSVDAGSINLALNAGSFTFGDLALAANADADDSINATGRFNGAFGGAITLTNTARFTGTSLIANAIGIGGDGGSSPSASGAGGDGNGGTVSLTNGVGGSLTLQTVGINVSGTGGEGGSGDVLVNGARGGSGFGGEIAISNAGTLAGTPTLTLAAAGTGGNGGTGGVSLDDFSPGADGGAAGSGSGGTIDLIANGATTAVQINALINAAGTGGTGGAGGDARSFESGNGGAGGFGQGGDISLVSNAGGALQITAGTGTLTLDSGGAGGAGGDEGFGLNPVGNPGQNGGSGGGIIDVLATGGALTINGNLVADATAVGTQDLRAGATGADSTGGTITTNASGGGALTVTGGMWLNASALAAIGNLSAGTGRGGTANMLMSGAGSSFEIQGVFPVSGFPRGPQTRSLYVDTSAYEPQSGNPLLTAASGGDTFGGTVNISFADGASTIAGQSQVIASAGRENPLSGPIPAPNLLPGTGNATGGDISIALANGTHQWNSFDATLETYAPGATANDGTIRVLLDNATLDAGVGFSFSTTTFGDTITNTADVIGMRLINGSSLTTSAFTAFYTEAVQRGVSSTPVTSGNILLELDGSTINSDIFYTSIVPNRTGTLATGGTMGLSALNGSTITGDVEVNIFASGGAAPNGSASRSGDINYLLDGSTHTGNLTFFSFGEGVGAENFGDPASQAIGGNQNLSIVNGSSFTGDITLSTFLETSYSSGDASGALGDIDGGAFSLAIDGSTVNIGVLDVSYGRRVDQAADFFAGANVAAPDFGLAITGSRVNIGDAAINLDATGGQGGAFSVGGNGQAGSILLTSDAASSLTINDASFSANGFGGQGGSAISSGDGAAGGTGTGGAISVFSLGNLDLNSLLATARGQGGAGGFGALGGAGGSGGQGQGGTAEFEVSTAPGLTVALGPLSLDSSATGGAGASGDDGFSSLTGGSGGAGGSAAGGTSRFRVTGAGASLAFDPLLFNLTASALGGTGGAGGNNLSGGTAGTGGDGGAATGGTVALEAGSGAELSLLQVSTGPFQMQVTGTGGAGGSGGAIDMLSGGTAGAGGNGGQGTGGSPTLRAVGGLITVGELDIRATGIGGSGGIGGTDGTVTLGADGNGGSGFGGTPLLETRDGSPGRLTLGTVVIDASGIGGGGTITGSSGGGQITITDASAEPGGLISMGSLTVTATGPLTPPGTASLTIEGASGPIAVTGDVNATVAGDINLVFGGNGRLAVGGTTTLDAGGNISLAHIGNTTGVFSLSSGTDLIATAGGNFIAGAGSIINAGRDVSITAQNIQFASIAAVRDLLLAATNGDITAVGAAGLVAGRVLDLDATQAIAIGDIESDLSIALTAGTTVSTGDLTSTGADTLGDERIAIIAGGDVSLGTVDAIDALTITGAGLSATSLDGESVTATMTGAIAVGSATSETTIGLSGTAIGLDNGDAPGNITLDASAGSIALGTINSETDLVATASGDIAFTGLTGRIVTLDAGGSIAGGTVAADRAVASGMARNVNLTAVGDIAITSASAVDNVVVRGASLTATSVTSGTGPNANIDVLVGGAIDIGSTSSGGQTVLTGSLITLGSGVAGLGTSVLTATTGAVDIGTFDSEEFLDIVSATTVDFVTLTARALSIDAVGNVTGTRAAADLDLASGRPRNVTVTTDGAINIAQLAAVDSVVARGASLTSTSVTSGTGLNDNIDVLVSGAIDIGTTSSGGQTVLTGSSITLGSGVAGLGTSVLTATTGAVDLGTFDSEEFLDIVSATTVDFVTLTARALSIDAVGNVTGTRAAADLALTSGRARNVSVTTDGAVAIGQLAAVDSVVVRGASLVSTSITSGTALNANIDVLVGGAINIGSTSSGGQTVLTGSSIILGSGVAGGGASVLTSTVGGVDLGTFDSESFLDIVSAGSVDFDTLTARAMSIDAQSNVTGTRAATDLDLASGRPRNVSITALNAVSVDQLAAIDNVIVNAFTLNTLDVTARGDLLATLGGVGNLTSINTGGSATVTGSSLVIGDGVSGGLALLTATVGDVDLGTWDAQGFFDIDAAGSVNFDRVTGRLVEVIAGGDITGNFAASDVALVSGRPRNVTLDAGGTVSIGEARSIGNVLLDGAAVDAGIVNAAGTGTFTATGLVAIADLTTGSATGIIAGSADIGTASTALFTANTTGAFAIDGLVTNGAAADASITAGGAITLGTIQGSRIVRLNGASITGGTISAVGSIDLDGGSVTLDRVASSNGVITIDTTVGGVSVDDLDATAFGIRVNSAADFDSLTIDAGGLVQIVADGNATLGTGNAGSSISVNAGGNITSGNLFAGTTSPGITLTAGGAATLANLTTNGLINVTASGALTGGLFASAGQITLRGSLIDITSAISSGVGGIAATSTSGNIAADLLRTASLSIIVASADAAAIGAIEAGSSARVTTVNDATLGPVTATSGQVALNIGGNLTAGNIFGGAASPALDINVGGNAQLGSVTSGGLLDIDAGGDLTADVLQANAGLTVDAASIAITSANSDTFGVGLRSTVGGVTADLLTAAGNVQVASATGATLGTLDAGANIDVTAGGTSRLGTATADGNLTVTVTGNLTTGALTAGATPTSILDINVTGNALVASAQSGFILDVDVSGALTGGTFASGATTIDAGSVNVTRVAGTAGGGVIVNATTGNALIGTVDSGGNARITALAGAARVGTLNAALLGQMIGRSVTLNTATVGGNLRLQATAGNVAGTGVIGVAGAIDLDATGDITFGTLVARGGAFTADAGGDLTFTSASASDLLAFSAGGAVSGGNLSADSIALSAGGAASLGNLSANGTITVGTGRALTAGDIATIVSGTNNSIALTSGGAMTLGDVTSGEGLSMIAGGALTLGTASTLNSDAASTILARGTGVTADLLATRLNSGAGVTVDARTGLADIGRIQAGGTSSVSGGSIALDSADVRGNLRLLATSGGIQATGLLDVRGAADFDAAGPVTLTTLLARAQIAIDTPGLLSFDRIANPGNNGGTIRLAAGSVQGGDLSTNVSGADDSIFVTTTGDLALTTVTSGQAITLAAGGALTLGSAQTLNSDAASFIAITGASVDAGSLATMVNSGANVAVTATAGAASLGTVTAGGNVTMAGETIALATGDIRGGLSLTSTVGDIALAPDGAGQIVVGGSTNLTSAGSILLTHTNNTGGLVSLASAGNIVAQADSGITSAAGSILSGNEVFILAGRDVDLADVRAVPGLVITAGGSVALANAAVTGPRGGSDITGIQIDAGLDPRGSSGYDSLGNVSITGSISSYSDIVINAGGTTAFAAGSQSLAGNGIVVRTGDDIIVGPGARLQSARDNSLVFDPANPFGRTGSIDLHAGGLTPLFSTPLTPIASLVVDGSIDAGRGAVIARANAIDGIDGAFAGSSLSFDIDNAPPDGAVLSDDNGLLTAPCLEGNVCLGSVAASNQLLVGQSSPADVLALTIQQGTVNAREIRISTRNDIVMGTSGIATTLNASDVFTATSRAGDVDLRDSTISSNLIRIEAAGSLLGSASLTSAGDVGITVGDSLFAGTISAGGELTTAAGAGGAREGAFSVPGTLAVGTLSLGAGAVNYNAGTIDIGSLAVAGTDVRLVATGLLSLGQTSGAASLDLAGGSVLGGDLLASGDIAILSGSDVELTNADAGGSVAIDLAGNLSFGLIQAGGDIRVNADGTATGGDLDAQGTIALDAARIAIGSASGNAVSLTSATDVLFDFLTSPNSISITATAGRIGGNTTAGLIETDGDLTLRARSIDLRDLAAGGTIDIAVTGTALTLGRLDAGADIVLGSAGSIFVDHADAVGNFTANSVRGFATGPNSIITGGDILIGAGGPVDLGNSSAGGLIDVSGTQIDFASLVAGTTIALSTIASSPTAGGTGNITGGSLQAGAGSSSLVTTAGDIVLSGNASVSGGLSLIANGGDIGLSGQTSAGGLLSLASSGTIATGNLASATGDVQADAGLGISVADVTAANDIRLAATSGDVGFGALSAGRDVIASAAGNLSGLSLDAGRDGDLQADRDSSGAGDLTLTGRARAVRNLNLFGANVSLANVVVTGVTPAPSNRLSGFVTINSTNGSLLVGDVTAPGMTLVSEGGDLVAGNLNAFDPVLAFGLPTVIDVSAFGGDITIASLNTVGDLVLFNADGTLTRVLGATNAGNDVFFSGSGEFRFDGAVIAGRDLIGRANGSTGAGVTFGAGLDIGRNVDVRARDGAIFLLPGLIGPSTIGGNLTFTARQIGLSAVDVGGSLALTATAGSVDATEVGTVGGAIALVASDDVTFGSLSAGGGSFLVDAGGSIVFGAAQSSDTITMTAAGDLAGGDLAAPGLVSLDAARIVIGDATAGSFAFASGSDILFDSLASDSSVDLVAANGRIGAHTGPGDLTSGGNITLLAREIALGTLNALGNVTGTTNLGAMDFARVVSGGNILLDSAGSIAVSHAEAAGNFTATAGLDFATGPDSVLTGGDIVIDAGGTVALGNSSADGLIAVTGQQIDFDTLTAGTTVSLQTVLDPQAALRGNGDITGQSITAGVGDSLVSARDGGDIAIAGTITADAVQMVANAGAITSGGLNTRLFAILNAAGAITLTGNSVGTNTFFAEGASIALGSSSISNGNVTLNARNGDVTGTGRIDADGELLVSATRSVSLLGDLVSASAIRIGGNSIALGNAASAGSISLRAATGGIGSTGTISAGRDISVDTAGGAALNELVAGDDVFFNGSGDISIANLLVTGDNPDSEEIGSNGTFIIDGSVFIDHAEIADNLTANVTGGFATGLNSILAGGDIVIDAGGPVALGNSSAGGLVDVTGSQIDFSTLAAGQTVTLLTQPSSQTGFGNGNITGTDLTAGAGASSVTSTFGAVAIGGQTTVAGSLAVGANQGVTLGTVAVQGGDLAATAGGSIALGSASASGNARLTAGGSITATGDILARGTLTLLAQTGAIAARDLIASELTATAGGSIVLGSASASGNARLTAGGSITATGDITARGTLTLLAQTGAIAARDLIASGVTATAAGSIGLRDVLLSGGSASLVSGGAVALRDVSGAGSGGVSITADGNLGFDDIVSAGGVSLLARNGGIDGVSVAAGGAVSASGQTVGLGTVAATGDVVVTAQTGALVAGSVSSSAGEVVLQGATAVDVATLAAATNATIEGGEVTVGSANAGGDLALTSGTGDGIAAGALTAGGAIAASAGTGGFSGTTLNAGGDVSLGSAAGIGFDTINAGGAASLVSTVDGNIAGTAITAGTSVAAMTGGSLAADTVSAGGAVNLSAVNGISLATLIGSSAQLAAAGGEVRVSVEINVPGLVEASGQSVFLRSTRNLAVTAIATAGDIDVLTERDLDVSGAEATGGNISLTSTGGVATVAGVNASLPASSSAAGGNVFIEAGENLNVAGAVTAANSIEMRAGERANINAAVVGREIDLRASDVAIASTGALGRLDATRSVTISGGSIARIGGADGTDQSFVIDNDEFARIQASELIGISASTAIILDQLDIRVANATSATGNVRGEGRVSFGAAEGIEVIGEVVMTGATADNALALATGGDVFLDASTGLLEINDGAGNYLGLIEVEAANFYAMTEQARADVEAAPSIEAIEERLAQNDGIDNPDGLIRTGTLDITTIASDVFIQNTAPGTRFEQRRGFTVDELLISDPGGTNQPIVINGIIAGATGIDAIPRAQISSSFDPGSTLNGCLIGNPSSCVQIPEHLGEGTFPVQDLIEEELEEDETSEPGLESGVLDTPLFELKDPLDSVEDPLLDDPVTGAGNEDLWVGDQPQP